MRARSYSIPPFRASAASPTEISHSPGRTATPSGGSKPSTESFDPSGGCSSPSRNSRRSQKRMLATGSATKALNTISALKQRGKGVLFATGHLGNWELSAYAHALLTEPMNVVVRPLDNPVIDAIVEQRRALSGNTLLSKRDFARSIFKALRDNEPVGILVDQNSSAENGAFVPFFGTLACANLTFARLAARSGAAVIPGFATWSENGSTATFCGFIPKSRSRAMPSKTPAGSRAPSRAPSARLPTSGYGFTAAGRRGPTGKRASISPPSRRS